jgi:D-alanyl-D-alanine carboxypeptidase
MKRIIFIALMYLLMLNVIHAQTFDPVLASKLQNTIDSIRIASNIKGISACVIYPGAGTWKGVSGISHAGTPVSSEMEFGIASNTKLFTGVLMLKLAETGLISIDDSLHEHLPVFNNIDSNITIRQLLNHTSGLADVTSVPGYPDSMLNDPNRIFTASELMSWAGPPLFSPGTDWNYCNTNYLLAAMIAESATGESYSQLLRDSILNPLQLDSTFLDVYETILYPVAHPWQAGFNNINIPRTSVNSAAWSAGAMYSTSGEMAQWYQSLMNGQVLNPVSFNELTTFVGSGNYGMGIAQGNVINRTVWYHGGQIWGGYNSSMMYDTTTGVVICVLINQLPAQAYQVSVQLLSSIISNPVGINEQDSGVESWLLYPNPFTDQLFIQTEARYTGRNYLVSDLSGKAVLTGAIESPKTTIDLSGISGGIYFMTIDDDGKQKFKLIKK